MSAFITVHDSDAPKRHWPDGRPVRVRAASIDTLRPYGDHGADERVRTVLGIHGSYLHVTESEDAILALLERSRRNVDTTPPVEVGSVWEWEPLKSDARETVTVTVTALRWNGEEWWIQSESESGRYWNPLDRWIEATVLIAPAEET